MKVKFTAELIDESGNKIVKEIEREIPNINEYGKPEEFYEIFDRYEKPVIEARNQIAEEITQEYLFSSLRGC